LSLIKKFYWFLAPSILQTGVAFATLPLAMLILGPQDYGAYAVVGAITGLLCSVACLGSTYLLSETFSGGKPDEIRQLISQHIVISGGLAILFATLLILTCSSVVGYFDNLAMVPTTGFVLSAIGIVPTTVWAIAADVLTLSGRAKVFSQIVTAQSLASAGALLFCLFVNEMGAMSLFVSGFVGAASLGLGAVLSLRRYFERPNFSSNRLQLFKKAHLLTGANLIEAAYQPVERNLLAVNSGLASLGLYVHAQQYQNILAAATKALARSVFPATLEEARQSEQTFLQTNRYWRFAYLFLSLAGLSFATLGDVFIGLLTHGKFVGAGAFAAFGIACLLVQHSGKPQTGLLYARGAMGPYTRFSTISSIAALSCALIAIPLLGVWGAILSIFTKQIVLRVAIQMHTIRIYNLPFHDGGAVAGLLLISLMTGLNELLHPAPVVQLMLFLLSAGLIVVYHLATGSIARCVKDRVA
jgi:O-antigen/teichoic acid export membrane protein